MAQNQFNETVMDHFMNPRNVGEIDNADAVGEAGSAQCGDAMTLYLKIDGGVITDAKFKTFGCGAAIATSSILTERIKGATPDEALKISAKTSEEVLSQLPKEKACCFTLAADALKLAVDEYRCKEEGIHEKGGFSLKELTEEN